MDKSSEEIQAMYEMVSSIKATYDLEVEALAKNPDLTRVGKAKELQKLKTEKQKALTALVTPLRKRAVMAALVVKRKTGARKALKSIESENMDYQKLQYYSGSIRSSLVLAGNDPAKIKAVWERAKKSGDRHLIRAALDTIPEMLPTSGPISGLVLDDLLKDMSASANMVDSAEAQRYENEAKQGFADLARINQVAEIVGDSLSEEEPWAKGKVMERVSEGIGPDPNTGELVIDFGEDPTELPDKVYTRLETEYQAKAKTMKDVVEHYGLDYSPETDGV